MSNSSVLRAADLRVLFRLANECRELGDDPVVWRVHCMREAARIVGAGVATFSEEVPLLHDVVMDGQVAWGIENYDERSFDSLMKAWVEHGPDYTPILAPAMARILRGDGTALTRSELVSDPEWYRSPYYRDHHSQIGVDAIMCSYAKIPAPSKMHSLLVLVRSRGERNFSERQKGIIRELHLAVTPWIGSALARFVDPAPVELPTRPRQVLKCLLQGEQDKQLARRLGISKHTVNQYVKQVFGHFGVRSRPELLARWVRRGWGTRFAWDKESEGNCDWPKVYR
jgi:DNA-binding CsgD family transcriptional regulator